MRPRLAPDRRHRFRRRRRGRSGHVTGRQRPCPWEQTLRSRVVVESPFEDPTYRRLVADRGY